MEEALIKLLKVVVDYTVQPDYGTSEEDDANVVDSIMGKAELALSPHARQELINHIGFVRRPF